MSNFSESVVEQATLEWLERVGWSARNGTEIAPGELTAERSDYGQVVLEQRLRDALARLNPDLPPDALEDAYRKLTRSDAPSLIERNRAVHRMLVDGVTVEYRGKEWFKPWRTISGREDAPANLAELQVVLEGVFDQRRFLDLLRYFIVFEDAGDGKLTKKMAGYHQFHAVNVAIDETLRAARVHKAAQTPGRYEAGTRPGGDPGDRRVGVVWHTQGSGKSLTMAFYAGRVILHPAMENPTVVVLTDRNDLDEQLFGTFARCRDLLRQAPVQAADQADLRSKLTVASGGVVFTTIQKLFPEAPSPQPSPLQGRGRRMDVLSDRPNIVVIADEAHRSQTDFIDGFA